MKSLGLTWIFQLIIAQRNFYLLSGSNAWLSSTIKSPQMSFSDISSLLMVFWFMIALELENTALAVLES